MLITLTADTAEKLAEWTRIVKENAPLFLKYQDLYTLASMVGYEFEWLLGVGWCKGYVTFAQAPEVSKPKFSAFVMVSEDQEPTPFQLKQMAARHMLLVHGEKVSPESMEYEYNCDDVFLSWNNGFKDCMICMSPQGQIFYTA